jgi:hypothetical protein
VYHCQHFHFSSNFHSQPEPALLKTVSISYTPTRYSRRNWLINKRPVTEKEVKLFHTSNKILANFISP